MGWECTPSASVAPPLMQDIFIKAKCLLCLFLCQIFKERRGSSLPGEVTTSSLPPELLQPCMGSSTQDPYREARKYNEDSLKQLTGHYYPHYRNKVSLCRNNVLGQSIILQSFFQCHPHPTSSHKNSSHSTGCQANHF